MPLLALRYLAWLIGLRLLLGVLEQRAGLPAYVATGVILAAAPAADVAMQAVRGASRRLGLADWGLIWAMCLALYASFQVALPAVLLAPVREQLATPEGLMRTATVVAATGAMMALFLWIGRRSAKGPGR
jgi:hypothetical protein